MKTIHLTLIIMFILSMFSMSSPDLFNEGTQTLSEKVLEENSLEVDNDDKSLQEKFILCFYVKTATVISFTSQSTYTSPHINTLLRPPIFS